MVVNMYKLITNQYKQFFDYNNCFHLLNQTDKILYLNEDTNETREILIEAQKINVEDFSEGNEEETVFVFVPEVAELQYYVTRVKNILE